MSRAKAIIAQFQIRLPTEKMISANSTGRKASSKMRIQKISNFVPRVHSLMGKYLPEWNHEKTSTSYVIPPVFQFMHANICDGDIQLAESGQAQKSNNSKTIPYGKHRYSDQAECTVYNALMKLSQDGESEFSPFIAINGLDIHRIRNRLHRILGDCDLDEFEKFRRLGEFDFLIMGPRIGIIAIEVKYSYFTQASHFAPGLKYFPEYYLDGVKQLKSLDDLLNFLKSYTGINSEIEVTRILFTPNLSKERFNTWLDSLEEISRDRAVKKLADIQLWYSEDQLYRSGEAGKVPLYYRLRETLRMAAQKVSNDTQKIYETYAPILVGLRSLVPSKERYLGEFEKSIFSEKEALLKEGYRVHLQDPLLSSINSGDSKNFLDCWQSMDLSLYDDEAQSKTKKSRTDQSDQLESIKSKVILTPEQRTALNGPEVQILAGSAGTGKTVIMQLKILELLDQRNRSIIVLAPDHYLKQYKQLCGNGGSEKYKVRSWSDVRRSFIDHAKELFDQQILSDELMLYQILEKSIKELIDGRCEKWLRDAFRYILDYDCIFIDDAFDAQEIDIGDWHIGNAATFAWMIYARMTRRKTVWMAIDTWTGATRFENGKSYRSPLISEFLSSISIAEGPDRSTLDEPDQIFGTATPSYSIKNFPVTALKKVMRCPENVYKIAYEEEIEWIEPLIPNLGHKIQGAVGIQIDQQCQSLIEAREFVWRKIKHFLDHLQTLEISLDCIAIITGEENHLGNGLSSFLIEQFHDGSCPEDLPHGKRQSGTRKREGAKVDAKIPWIGNWFQCSSMEWPVVIFATCEENGKPGFGYPKYRACSRATAKLIEITAYY